MLITVLIVGVIRPDPDRIMLDISNNIKYLTESYPEHQFSFIVVTYHSKFQDIIAKYFNIFITYHI